MTALSEKTPRGRELSKRTARIRELNDAFRRSFSGSKVTMTAGVYALADMVQAAALQKAATFDQFTEDYAQTRLPGYRGVSLCSSLSLSPTAPRRKAMHARII